MLRMPQKLLIFIFILSLLCLSIHLSWASSLKLTVSISKGPEGKNLYQPLGMFFDPYNQRFYVADTGNNRLLSFSLNGTPLKSFDAGGQLKGPYSLVIDSEGKIWVVERPFNSLTEIDLKAHRFERHQLSCAGHPVLVDRIALWQDYLLVLDRASGMVLLYDKDLSCVKSLRPDIEDFKGFFDFKVKNDRLWGLENLTGRILALDLKSGKILDMIRPKFLVSLPVSFELDNRGNFYLLDRYQKVVLVFDKSGRLKHRLFKRGYLPGELNYPWQLLLLQGKLLVLDEGNGRIDIWGH